MVDELELIRRFPHTRQREQALETLRLLIDETGKNGLPGCLLIFTGTDTFFEDDRAGLKSYEALDNRVALPGGLHGMISMKQPVISLEKLNQERLIAAAEKIRDIHGVAYDWKSRDYIPDDFLIKLVQGWTTFGDGSVTRKPRPFLRELIHILDLCEENPGIEAERDVHQQGKWQEGTWVIHTTGLGKAQILTFAGDRINRTLALFLKRRRFKKATANYKEVDTEAEITDNNLLIERISHLLSQLKQMGHSQLDTLEEELSQVLGRLDFSKFSKCLPDDLWSEAMAERALDIQGLGEELSWTSLDFKSNS